MMKATIIFYLVVLGLTGVAIYIQVTATNLSLPIPSSTTISLILLPWISALATFTSRLIAASTPPTTHSTSNKSNTHNGPSPSPYLLRLASLLLPTLHIFQSILTIILLTLLSQTMTTGPIFDCRLTTRWQTLWKTHDRRSIETIQDAFECCGFNSVKDMAWPRDTCASLYGRNRACRGEWNGALRRTSGLGLGICLVVLGFQVYQFSRVMGTMGFWEQEARTGGGYKQILSGDAADEEEGGQGRVVEDASDEEVESAAAAEGEDSRLLEQGGTGHQVSSRESNGRQTDYGAVEDRRGAAVVPSGLGVEENHWR